MRQLFTGPVTVLIIVALLLVSLNLMSNATQGSAKFGELYSVLLVINALGLVWLAGLIGWNLYTLVRQARQATPGARLTARMVTVFVVLAVTPVVVVYYFSLQFLNRGIDSWFDVRIEQALDDALELGQTSLDLRMREYLKQVEQVAADLALVEPENLSFSLDDARQLSDATELSLIGPKGHIIAFSNIDPTAIVPGRPADAELMRLKQGGSYIGLDPIGESGLHVRVVVTLPEDVPTTEPRTLQALFTVPERVGELAAVVETAYGKYRELAYLRRPLKVTFTLTLSLVLLISLFAAVWAAFFSARRAVAPLRDLALGTQAVAAGDYETQLPPSASDEVGFLVASFNDMTRRLRQAHTETRRSQHQLEEQRAYLETVLDRLSSGVITMDEHRAVHTANRAAEQILELDLAPFAGADLDRIAASHPHAQAFVEVVARHAGPREDGSPGDWREEIRLHGAQGQKVIICRGTPLHGVEEPLTGHVIVFDDVTALMQAQRNAAWSEVARRLAHEIKNPLTPIQLSAERLRHKYMTRLEADDATGFERLTRTIVSQVESMKGMVNAFSDYARSPRAAPVALELDDLVADVAELYRDETAPTDVQVVLDSSDLVVEADPDRLRQLLHNLIKNALEAAGDTEAPRVRLSTRAVHEDSRRQVELRVEDSGPGIAPEVRDQVFEPYVTTKTKGTGLGLAIVKKIAEEHGGSVWVEEREGPGACITMRFPGREREVAEPEPEQRRRAG